MINKEIGEIYSAFDEPLIHNARNEVEMEEPVHPQDIDDHADILNSTDDTSEVVLSPHELKNTEIYLLRGDRTEIAKVSGRKCSSEALYFRRKHTNPRLDSRIFTVGFSDWEQQDIAYNIFAEHMYTQTDTEAKNTDFSLQSLITA
jgi:hypothetical protein